MKVPAQHLSPAPLVPNRNLDLPETDLVRWKDVTPRLAAAYDLFGNGKTAVKVSLSKYVIAQGVQGAYGDSLAPVNRLANFVARTWTDNNRNFIPDCDLTNVLAQGPALTGALRTVDNCGLMQNQNFGLPTPSTTVDPAVLNGFGVRPYNWEFSTGIQHQILPRVSADFGYFRRWFGNFAITDNRAIRPSDYSPYSITAPVDPRLPGGGGYVVSGLFDQNFTGAVDNYFTAAANYGEQLQRWNGVDMTVNARLGRGALLQGGVSTGRTLTDNCDLATKSGNPSQRFCRVETAFLTQVKFLGVYAIPKVDVQLSGAFQSIPGPQISANLVVGNAQAAPSLGRNLTNGTATVNLIEPGTQYGERLNQLDLRFSKIFRINKARLSANLDLYNAFNVNTVLAENATFTTTTTPATWRVPTSIVTARFFKFSAQFDF